MGGSSCPIFCAFAALSPGGTLAIRVFGNPKRTSVSGRTILHGPRRYSPNETSEEMPVVHPGVAADLEEMDGLCAVQFEILAFTCAGLVLERVPLK